MTITRAQKEDIVSNLTEDFKNAKSVVFTSYTGISANDMKKIRKDLLEKESRFQVAKKTLATIAAKNAEIDEIPDEVLGGQIGFAFSFGDEVAAPKAIDELSKTYRSLKIMGGILEKDVLSKTEMTSLAKIPSKEVLIAKLLGSIKSPTSGFVSVLSGVMRGFACALFEIKNQKEAQGS